MCERMTWQVPEYIYKRIITQHHICVLLILLSEACNNYSLTHLTTPHVQSIPAVTSFLFPKAHFVNSRNLPVSDIMTWLQFIGSLSQVLYRFFRSA